MKTQKEPNPCMHYLHISNDWLQKENEKDFKVITFHINIDL